MNITDINHLKELKHLRAVGECGIIDNSIKKLSNLETLNMSENENILNIDHMTKLKELDADGLYELNNEFIKKLTNLERLSVEHNMDINDVSHMTRLREIKYSQDRDEIITNRIEIHHGSI